MIARVPTRKISDWMHKSDMAVYSAMYEQGVHVELAVAAALHHCATYGRPTPPWLAKAGSELLCKLLNENIPKPTGKNSPSGRYIHAREIWTRWDWVGQATAEQRLIKKDLAAARRRKASRAVIKRLETDLKEVGKYWTDALDRVAKRFGNSIGSDSVKKSYSKVQKGSVSYLHHHRFEAAFLHLVGINIDFDNQGN